MPEVRAQPGVVPAPRPNLDDPEYAAFAWALFRRILGGMAMQALA